jgi:hypothetical protein
MSAAGILLSPPLRGATARLADELQAGRVYRREDLARLSNAVDRHLNELVSTGLLKKLAQGLYYAPKQSNFAHWSITTNVMAFSDWATDSLISE